MSTVTFKLYDNYIPSEEELNVNQYARNENFEMGDINGSSDRISQTFIPSKNGVLSKIVINTQPHDTPVPGSILTIEIRTTSDGLPTSTVLATENRVITELNEGENEIIFSAPTSVVLGTKYAIVSYKNSENRFIFKYYVDNIDSYLDGMAIYSTNSGASWSSVEDEETLYGDLCFKVYLESEQPEFTFPVVFSANYPHTGKKIIEHENVRGKGSITVDAGQESWDLVLKGVLKADDYDSLMELVDDMEENVQINVPYTLVISNGVTTYEYRVKRITPIEYQEDNLKTDFLEYIVTLKCLSW